MAAPVPGGRVYNVVDDDPAPREVVRAHAEALLRLRDAAAAGAAGAAFPPAPAPWSPWVAPPGGAPGAPGDKRVLNRRLRAELGVSLRYPSYREGCVPRPLCVCVAASRSSGGRPF